VVLAIILRLGIKTNVLVFILQESAPLTRLALSRVISSIAKIAIPLNAWPDLVPWLFGACKSAEVAHREVFLF
jgi:hypothetical protein